MGTGKEQIFAGIPAAPGVSFGKVHIHIENDLYIPHYLVDKGDDEEEIKRFELALLKTRHEISEIRNQVADRLGEEEAQIFDAHLLILEDPALIDETVKEVHSSLRNVEYSFHKISQKYIEAFQCINDEFIRERLNDIKDVSRRILYNLAGEKLETLESIDSEQIIVAHDFSPSDAAVIPTEFLQGFITEAGSRTSHVVIMAKAASVPAVVGVHDLLNELKNGDDIIVDGYEGVIIIHPSEDTLFRYGETKKQHDTEELGFLRVADKPAITTDGIHVEIMANIEGNNEIPGVLETGSDGIGLYRTEYLFLKSGGFPSEEVQFKAYKEVVEALGDSLTILRTYDLGGDKVLLRKDLVGREDNPYLGCRAIRFSLLYPEVFKDQLRAMLRASAFGNLKIMFPMISSLEELQEANQLLEEVKNELSKKKIKFNESIEVGIMIEIPSAVAICDILAKHCDFFSVGTNDLMQYMFAVDRGNDRVAHLYQPGNPGFLRVLRQIVDSSNAANQPVSICGELAGDLEFVPLLIGLGMKTLSVPPNFVPSIKYLVRQLSLEESEALTAEVMAMHDAGPIIEKLKAFYDSKH